MSYLHTKDTNVPRKRNSSNNVPRKQNSSNFWGNALLVGGAIVALLAMAGWLYFLGWLSWHFVTGVLT